MEQERKMIEEEKKRNKAEEERMMKKEEKRKKDEVDRKKRQQERNRMHEEKHKLAEMRVKEEKERRKRDEEKKKNEEDKVKKLQEEFQPFSLMGENTRRSDEQERKKKEEAQSEGVINKKRVEETQKEEESVFLTMTENTRKGKNNDEKIKFREEMKTKEGPETKNKTERSEEETLRQTNVTINHEEVRRREEEIKKSWMGSKGEGTSTVKNKVKLQQRDEERITGEDRQLLKNILLNKQIENHTIGTKKSNDEEKYRNTEDKNTSKQEKKDQRQHEGKTERREVERKRGDEEEKHKGMEMFSENDKWKEVTETDVDRSSVVDVNRDKEVKLKAVSESLTEIPGGEGEQDDKKEGLTTENELEEKKQENNNLKSLRTRHQDSLKPLVKTFKEQPISCEMSQQHLLDNNTCYTPANKTPEQQESQPAGLSERAEQKRLNWMKDCVSWSEMCLQNRRKQQGSCRRRRWVRRAADAHSLPPLCPQTLLQTSGWKSLQEVTSSHTTPTHLHHMTRSYQTEDVKDNGGDRCLCNG